MQYIRSKLLGYGGGGGGGGLIRHQPSMSSSSMSSSFSFTTPPRHRFRLPFFLAIFSFSILLLPYLLLQKPPPPPPFFFFFLLSSSSSHRSPSFPILESDGNDYLIVEPNGNENHIAAQSAAGSAKFAAQPSELQISRSSPRLNVVNIRLPVEAQAAILDSNAEYRGDLRTAAYARFHRQNVAAQIHQQNAPGFLANLASKDDDDDHHHLASDSNNVAAFYPLHMLKQKSGPDFDRSKNMSQQSPPRVRVEMEHPLLLPVNPSKSGADRSIQHETLAGTNATHQSDPATVPLQPKSRSTAAARKRWVQKYWDNITILHSDEVSQRFPNRMNEFLTGRSSDHDSEGQEGAACEMQFFMTWFAPVRDYGPRERLALESVFRSHPSACVVMLSRTFDSPLGSDILDPFTRKGFRIKAITPDVQFLASSTPAAKWFKDLKKGLIDPGWIVFNQNLSNLIRLLVLYKYGGIYIDTDIVVMRNWGNLSNVVGAQSVDPLTKRWSRLNNAVLIFDKESPVVLQFIREFSVTFDGNKWGHNGPYLLTRVLQRMLMRNHPHDCKVLEPSAFYPVDWNHISKFFQAPPNNDDKHTILGEQRSLLRRSYSLHLWNKISRDFSIEPTSTMDSIFLSTCVFCDKDTYHAALTGRLASSPVSAI